MSSGDDLDITLALVDRLLAHGPGQGIDPRRYQKTLLIADPFIDLWKGDVDTFMTGVGPEDVEGRSFSLFAGTPEVSDFCLSRMDIVDHRLLRKVGIPFRSRSVVRCRAAFVNQSGLPTSGHRGGFEMFAQLASPKRWLVAHSNSNRLPEYDPEISAHIQMGLAIMWEMHFHWSVEFIGASGCSFSLPSSPEGAREMFRDRDKPEGRDRRSALRHWVREHSRVSRKGNEHQVASHLRCPEPFSWRGYTCRLRPSAIDENRTGKK